jgi:AcrR family transcriptional regulator
VTGKTGSADPAPLEAAPGSAELSHNLVGQRLGRKGRDTRERILAAAAKLLAAPDAPTITLTAVAREAGLGMTSLYLYFRDLSELLAAVLDPIMDSVEEAYLHRVREPWPDDVLGERCRSFVAAYYGFWTQHTRVLHLRNAFSDNGDERMLRMRHRGTTPLLQLLVQQMGADPGDPDSEAYHMATVLLTGLERMATVVTDPRFPHLAAVEGPPKSDPAASAQAEGVKAMSARVLELAIRDGRTRN